MLIGILINGKSIRCKSWKFLVYISSIWPNQYYHCFSNFCISFLHFLIELFLLCFFIWKFSVISVFATCTCFYNLFQTKHCWVYFPDDLPLCLKKKTLEHRLNSCSLIYLWCSYTLVLHVCLTNVSFSWRPKFTCSCITKGFGHSQGNLESGEEVRTINPCFSNIEVSSNTSDAYR